MNHILQQKRDNIKVAIKNGWLPPMNTKVFEDSSGGKKVRINKCSALSELESPLLVKVDLYAAILKRTKLISQLHVFYHPDFVDSLFDENDALKKINQFNHSMPENSNYFTERIKIINEIENTSLDFEQLKAMIINFYTPYQSQWDTLFNTSRKTKP